MSFSISLQPQLLRTSFKGVRAALVGETREITPPTQVGVSVSWVFPRVTLRNLGLSRFFQPLLTLVIIASVVVGAVLVIPDLYYQFFPADVLPINSAEKGSPLGGNFAVGSDTTALPSPSPTPTLPPQDMTLPEGRWLIIPRIGVRTELQATEDPEKALATGVWMVPDFGLPGQTDLPLIAAAHRYGWQWWWKTDYWKYHSFYLLPETEPGDLIEIIDDHRKYTYEIYAGEEGEEITDYEADLILYTCKFLNSPIRHFRYARLVDWQKNTQS